MSRNTPKSSRHAEIQALVRLYRAIEGTAIGLASISMDGLDQSWRDRVQRIRALPREAPRRKQMIEALGQLIEQTLWQWQSDIEALHATQPVVATEAAAIAARGAPTDDMQANNSLAGS